jgi:hypothetical protein
MLIGWATAVLVMNMADPLSADWAVVNQCIAICCTKVPQLIWCNVQISINVVMFHLYCVCACGGVHVLTCVSWIETKM